MPKLLPDLTELDNAQLIEHFGATMLALRERGIVRSGNNPIADIAERIVATYVGGALAEPNEKSFDVRSADDKTLQVKGLRRTQSNRTTLSALRSLAFDELAVVVFEIDMTVVEGVFVPVSVVEELMGWSNTWQANRVSLTKKFLADDRVVRVPAEQLLTTLR
jgi:hypothetical protein